MREFIARKWHPFRLWIIRNAMTILAGLLIVMVAVTLGLMAYLNARETSRAAEIRRNLTNQLDIQTREFEATRGRVDESIIQSHDERVEVVKYIRCVVLLAQSGDAIEPKELDECLTGKLREDVLREQDFLAL